MGLLLQQQLRVVRSKGICKKLTRARTLCSREHGRWQSAVPWVELGMGCSCGQRAMQAAAAVVALAVSTSGWLRDRKAVLQSQGKAASSSSGCWYGARRRHLHLEVSH